MSKGGELHREASMSQATASQVGSVSSTGSSKNQSGRSASGVTFFTNTVPIIPLVQKIDKQYPRRLMTLGVLIEVVQVFGWVLNSHTHFGPALHAVSTIVYSSHFPIWDGSLIDAGFAASLAVTVVYCLVIILLVLWCARISYKGVSQSQAKKSVAVVQAVFHAVSSFLLVPICSSLLAFSVCDGDDNYWSTGEDCSGALKTFLQAILLVLLVVFFIECYIVKTMAYDSSIHSTHFLARAHPRADKLECIWKFTTTCLYHILHARGKMRWFHLYFMLTGLFLSCVYAFYLPYFHGFMNKLKTSTYLTASWFAFIALLTNNGGAFTEMQIDLSLVGCGLLPIIAVGIVAAEMRVSSVYCMWKVKFLGGVVEKTPLIAPMGLPAYCEQEDVVIGEEGDGLSEMFDPHEGETDKPCFSVSYIDRVLVATDTELAARYVAHYKTWTDEVVPSSMLDEGVRLFHRAMILFPGSDIIPLQLAFFTCWHSSETRVQNYTLHMYLDQIAKMECSLSVKYQALKLTIFIKNAIGMKDNTHVKIWRSAQKLHRDVLSQMSSFWGKLLSTQLDTVQLSVITNAITKKREQASEEFRGVLAVAKDDKVVLSYALFLEQVMHDEENAMRMRDQVDQGAGSEYSRRTRQEFSREVADTSGHSEQSLSKLKYTIVFMVVIWVALFVGALVFETTAHDTKIKIIDGLETSGKARMLTQQAGYYALDLCALDSGCRSSVLGGVAATEQVATNLPNTETAAARKAFLVSITRDLQAAHKELMVGPTKSTYPLLMDYVKWDTAYVLTDQKAPGVALPISLWGLGYETVAVLRNFYGNASDGSVLGSYRWVISNIDDVVAEMFTEAIRRRAEEADDVYRGYLLWGTLALALCLAVLLTIYLLLVSNFEEIDQAKLEALNLFTLIPKPEIAKLQHISKMKLNLLDQKGEQTETKDGPVEVLDDEGSLDGSEAAETSESKYQEMGADSININDEIYTEDEGLDTLDNVVKQGLGILLVLAVFTAGLTTFILMDEHYEAYLDEADARAVVSDYRVFQLELESSIEMFVVSGKSYFLAWYLSATASTNLRDMKKRLLRGTSTKPAFIFDELLNREREHQRKQLIILRLAASYHGTPTSLLMHIKDLAWEEEEGLRYAGRPLSSSEKDLALPSEEKIELVKVLLRDKTDVTDLARLTVLLMEEIEEVVEARTDHDLTPTFTQLVIVLDAVSMIIFLVIAASAKRSKILIRNRSLLVVALFYAALLITSIVLATLVSSTRQDYIDTAHTEVELVKHENRTVSEVVELLRSMRNIHLGEGFPAYHRYWHVYRRNAIAEGLKFIYPTSWEEPLHEVHELHRLSMISMSIYAMSLDFGPDDEYLISELGGLMWDHDAESSSTALSAKYPDDPVYKTTAGDAMLPKSYQRDLAFGMVTGARYSEMSQKIIEDIKEATKKRYSKLRVDIKDVDMKYKKLRYATVGVSAGVVAAVVWYFILLALGVISSARQQSKGESQQESNTFKAQVCVGLLAILFGGIYTVQVFGLYEFKTSSGTLVHTSGREFAIASAQITATKLAYAPEGWHWLLKQDLQKKLDYLEEERAKLYFGEDRTSGSLNKLTGASELFDTPSSIIIPSCAVGGGKYGSEALLGKGVDIAMSYWVETAKAMTVLEGSSNLQTQLGMLRDATDVVVLGLEQSTERYHTSARDDVDTWFMFFILAVTLIIVVVVLELLAVLRPVISELVNQEKGTKLMLKMIPEEVRVQVPVIQEFLDNGQMRDTDLMELVNDSVNEMSNIPIIAIDHVGTIIRFTWKGEGVFGWQQSEVVGANIKMLMPPEYAVHHSQWLENYLRTGTKKIIGTVRRIEGYRKNGTRFPLEIAVREHRPPGEDPTYIATIQDLTKSLELEMAMKLNEAIRQTSNVPLISVDTLAIITGFNKAAELCFGFTEEEALGQNVNILMPEETAKHHDGYIASYIKSGIKKVIDTDRMADGQRKNGQIFPLALSIKEIKLSDFGSSSLFLGYIRDRTMDLIESYQHLVHTNISELSPVPIISINEVGEVLVYSKKCEHIFGAPSADILGTNIKILMPPDVAAQHDGYLETYLTTGKRNLIDQLRHVVARKVDPPGEQVHLSIEVKEVMLQNSRVYVAFLSDLSEYRESKLIHATNVQLVEDAPIPIIKIDQEGIVDLYNDAAVSSFQYSKASIIGRNIKMLVPPEVAAKHDGYLKRYVETRVKHVIGTTFITTAKRNDGSLFMCKVKIDEVLSSITKEMSFLAYVYDIEDERATAWLQLTNEHIRENSPSPIIAMTQTGVVQTFSKAATKVWGFTPKEVIGKNVKLLMPKSIAANHDSYLSKYLKTGIKTIVDTKRTVQAKRKDDSTFPMELWVKEIVNEGVKSYVGYATDLTEADEVEKNRFLSSVIFKESLDAIIKIDSFGIIGDINTKLCELSGYAFEELQGQNVKMLMPDKIAVRHDELLANYRKTGIGSVIGRRNRVKLVRKDKSVIQIELMVEEISLEGMEPLYVGFMKDITDFVAREAENMASDTLASLSSTPLVAIDDKGIIIRYSKASMKCFGWTSKEATGRNVNILMAPHIAQRHDGYLRAYRKLGVKKVIDTKTIAQGMRKDGTLLEVELHIREIITNGVSLFIGHLRDCTDDVHHVAMKQVADAIFQRSIEPIVVMDERGTVQAVNRRTIEIFEYELDEIVGQNINKFMPDEIAVRHDGYLLSYLKHGVKKVLDSSRLTYVKAKSGELKPIELQPKEIKNRMGNIYVAFVRPMEKELERETAVALAESTLALSSSPIIAITMTGIITLWKNCEEVFGWEEKDALGQNIKIILPPEVAVEHNGYLKRYRQTKIPTVLNSTRRLSGVRKTGQTVPVDVSIREAIVSDEESFYVANIRDASVLYQEEVNVQIGETIKELADAPIISIDQEGKILVWNRAAEVVFDVLREDALGRNVNFITPPSIRSHHDGYLQRYRKTRVKRVIGTSKEVEGWKLGKTFPLLLHLREVTVGGELNYFAYLKDLSEQKAAEKQRILNNQIIQNSPLSFIAINQVGLVQSFSTAAEKVFGYSANDVVGNNVKMLMPEEVARRHDGLLARYKETGVKRVVDNVRLEAARHKNGNLLAVEMYVKEVALRETKIFMGYLIDKTKTASLLNDQKLSTASNDLVSVPIIYIQTSCIIESANEAACRLFEKTKAEMVGRNVSMLMPEETAINHDAYVKRYLTDGVKRVIDTSKIVTGMVKGELLDVELSLAEVQTDAYHVFVGYFQDLRKLTELNLLTQLGETIRHASPSPLITINGLGIIQNFNMAAEHLFGFTEDHVRHRNVRILMPDEVSEKHDSYIQAFISRGGGNSKLLTPEGFPIEAETKSGNLFKAMLRVFHTADHTNGHIFVGCISSADKK